MAPAQHNGAWTVVHACHRLFALRTRWRARRNPHKSALRRPRTELGKTACSVGLRGVVGLTSRLDRQAESALEYAGAGIFCTTSEAMLIHAQAGRWAELVTLLRTGFDVLLSDVDVGWARNPLPYMRTVLRTHPHASMLFS